MPMRAALPIIDNNDDEDAIFRGAVYVEQNLWRAFWDNCIEGKKYMEQAQ